jgi:hypothetical protein
VRSPRSISIVGSRLFLCGRVFDRDEHLVERPAGAGFTLASEETSPAANAVPLRLLV